MEFVPQWTIEKKRDGHALSDEDIREFISRYNDGRLPDYQMAALAMAILLKGMEPREILALTDAMMRSGDCLSWDDLDSPTADKHSTGGIGDKLSIPLAPLVASCGVAVPMISGRGLGITGGTLDKLDSIPGYQTSIDTPRFKQIVREVGCSIIGQTKRLAPADRKLYALRDVTGTVPSIPLITASILSKKFAEGAQTLVFDVKCGTGAFMKTPEDAQALAASLVSVAQNAGRNAAAIVNDMSQPTGRCIGNALEILESIEVLKGQGPADTLSLILRLAEPMLLYSKVASSSEEAQKMLREKLASGAALESFKKMLEAHGADPNVADHPEKLLPQAPHVILLPARESMRISRVDAETIGKAVLLLGGGRRAVTDSIDYAVGISKLVKIGESVDKGAPLMLLHCRDKEQAKSLESLLYSAFA